MTVTMGQNDSLARHSMTEIITLISLRETYFSIPSSIISSTWKSNRRPANKQANNLFDWANSKSENLSFAEHLLHWNIFTEYGKPADQYSHKTQCIT